MGMVGRKASEVRYGGRGNDHSVGEGERMWRAVRAVANQVLDGVV